MKKLISLLMALVLVMSAASAMAFENAAEITLVSRESGSGTRGAFIELMGIEQKDADGNKVDHTSEDAVIQNGTAQVLTTVAGDENAIGYISLGSLNDTVKALKVNGVEATVENIQAGEYAVSRPFNIAYKGELSATAQDFVNYILGADGQQIVSGNGYVPMTVTEYKAAPVAGKIVIGGSSSVTPIMEKLAEAYKAINANVEIEVQQSDSSTGMTGAADGTFDIGMASRDLKDSETEAGLQNVVIAMDGIAVIVNLNNTTEDVTSEQVMKIFTGETTTWELN